MNSVPYKWLAKAPRAQISEAHKFYFVHIPKCGGTSFDELPVFLEEYAQKRSGHRSLRYFLNALGGRAEEFRGFTVVRNPWDRIASAFTYLRSFGSGTPMEREVSNTYFQQHADVNGFVEMIYQNPKVIDNIGHIKKSSEYCDLNLLHSRNLKGTFMVVKLEEIGDRLKDLRIHLRLGKLELQHKRRSRNSTVGKRVNTRLSAASLEMISEIYVDDMEMFGYTEADACQAQYFLSE